MNKKSKLVVLSFFEELLKSYYLKVCIDNEKGKENIKVFKLKDIQNGDLGDIGKFEFIDLYGIIDILDPYHEDYIFATVAERLADKEVVRKDDFEYIAKCYLESNKISKVLQEITPYNYEELLEKAKEVDVTDIKYIIQSEDRIYENICRKYLNTISNEMIIENNDELIHFFIDDDFISLKDELKINIDNYKNYLANYDCIYRYSSYKELYEAAIYEEIINDISDLGLYNEKNEWNFYLSFEELKDAGLGHAVQSYFPLIEKHIITDEMYSDFYHKFTLKQLEEFEKALHLFYETNEITYDKDTGTIYSENYNFNIDILRLSESLINHEDFIEKYEIKENEDDWLTREKIIEYFKENGIKNLKQYGSDGVEGLYSISFLVSNLLDKLDIKYSDIVTEDVSDGKFETTIYLNDEQRVYLYTKPKYTAEMVADDLIKALCDYEKELQNQDEMEI